MPPAKAARRLKPPVFNFSRIYAGFNHSEDVDVLDSTDVFCYLAFLNEKMGDVQ